MNDMDVFLLLSLYPKLLRFTEKAAIALINAETGLPVSELDAKNILNHPPKTKQLVHALHDRGFTNKFIQEHLDLAQPTVSYHLSTNPNQYINPAWYNFVNHWRDVFSIPTSDS